MGDACGACQDKSGPAAKGLIMKRLFLAWIIALQAVALSGAETTARLKETSTPWLPGRYFVEIALATNLSASALNASMFRVERAGVDQPVRLTAVTYAGFASEDTPPTYSAEIGRAHV